MEYAKKIKFHRDISNPNEILKILDEGKSVKNIYFICINKKTRNLMDIIETTEFTKKIFSLKDYIIIGIANSKKSAFDLSADILEEYYMKNKTLSGFRKQFIVKRRR